MKDKKRRNHILFVLISLILHMLLLLAVFSLFKEINHTQQKNKPLSLDDTDNDWVSRTAHSSPVILFEDPPNPPQPLLPEPPEPQEQQGPDESMQSEKAQESDHEQVLQEINQDEDNLQTMLIQEKKEIPIPENKELQQQLKHEPNRKIPRQRKLTMADLVSGFLRHIKEPTNAAFDVKTDKKGMPADEQIKHERYIQKIFHCLQVAGKHIGQQPPTQQANQVGIILLLRRDGRLQDVSIAQTSGNNALDQYVIAVIQNAANTFPPVPSYLQGNPYTLPFNWVFTRY